jgi:hypothetical protein
VSAPGTSFRDEDAPDGERITYQVIAVDADGLESAPADLPTGAADGSGASPQAPNSVATPPS